MPTDTEMAEYMREPQTAWERNARKADLLAALHQKRAELETERTRRREVEVGLRVAADDLGKAVNQFASIKASQEAGHTVLIDNNPDIFAEKEARARSVLASHEPSEGDVTNCHAEDS